MDIFKGMITSKIEPVSLLTNIKNKWNNIYRFKPETVLLGVNVMAMDSWTAALAMLENAGKICKML